MKKPRILIVEDEAVVGMEVESILDNLGYEVTSIVNNSRDAIFNAAEDYPDLVLMDIRIRGDKDGIETAGIIRNRYGIPVIFATAYLDMARIERAKITMPFGYVLKPIQERELRVTLEMALYVSRIDAHRREAEEALRKSQHRLATHIRLTPMGVIEFDKEYRITNWNPGARKIFGYSAAEAVGRSTFDILLPPYEHAQVRRIHDWETAGAEEHINDNLTRDGRIITCQWFNTPILDGDNKVIGLTATCQDITERKKTLEALRDSEEKYRNVVENTIEAICVIQDGFFRYFNPATVELFGYPAEELSRLPTDETVHPGDKELLASIRLQRSQGKHVIDYSHRIITKDGREAWIDAKVVSITWEKRPALLVFLRNITEQKKSRELMIQTEKMMSLGGLAAGMAHELNNPLGAIVQSVQNVQRRLSPDLPVNRKTAGEFGINLQELQPYLEKRNIFGMLAGIQESGKKAGQIIQNMLQFSRNSESNIAPVNLAKLLEKTLDLAGKDYNVKQNHDFRRINIQTYFDPELPLVPCTETEIEQVIFNILKNAAWAMLHDQKTDNPQISISVRQQTDSACIEIEDNGPGMDENTRSKVFEPFFTTKPVGQGTGLGLSVSYMIITNNHKGSMEVASKVGQGTRFIIRLPLHRE